MNKKREIAYKSKTSCMDNSENLPVYLKYWGKAKIDYKSEGAEYHLLPYHCLDVAAVADIWLQASNTLLKQLSFQLNKTEKKAKQIILFYILLHDLGKFDARFQNFREDIRQQLQGNLWEIEPDLTYYSHGSCGYHQFCEIYGSNEAMKAVAGHHGYCDTTIQYDDPDADKEILELDYQARKQWIQYCLDFCDLDEIPNIGEVPMLAGLCSISDWIGSSITNFTSNPNIDLFEYYQQALPRAKAALIETGMVASLQGFGFDFLFPDYQPRGVQTLLDDIPIKAGLTLVESDTGSGKTEFALAYSSMLIQAGLADGVVFGLPTQATANGLFDRIGEAAGKLFPDASPTLAHGKSKYYFSDESGFLHQSNKRAFLGSVSVATVDQILMGVLGVRHQFVRSFGTRKSVLILDEIHSFDAYMQGLINQVLKGQHQAYSSVILLSATLPNTLKRELLKSYQGKSSSQEYPLVSHTDITGNTQEYRLDRENTSEEKKVIKSQIWRSKNILPNADKLLQIKSWVEAGAVVGIICNTVADAQRLYHQFKKTSCSFPVDLFHARYTFSDRKSRENKALSQYGKLALRKGRLLIATQVIEQSLDLDFDILISQIAPIEYLMQRMGRLWRHERGNSELHVRTPSVSEPLFITLLPESQIDEHTNPKTLSQHYAGSGYVYPNIRLLYRTEKYLESEKCLQFPTCYRSAINYVHQDSPLVSEPEVLTKNAESFEMKSDGSHYSARQISNFQSKPMKDVDPRCALLTREGEMSTTMVLFNKDNSLLHGGDYEEQQDRENSSISLAPKHAKGIKDSNYYCYKAIVGQDIDYNEMGFITTDLKDEFNTGS